MSFFVLLDNLIEIDLFLFIAESGIFITEK